jgi:hypothetical protein
LKYLPSEETVRKFIERVKDTTHEARYDIGHEATDIASEKGEPRK